MTHNRSETYEVRADETTSEAVIRAVSTVRGVDPVEMDACLYDAIDPTVLDAVFESGEGYEDENRNLTFTFAGCEVAVDSGGRIAVTVIEPRANAAPASGASPEVFHGTDSPWQLVFQ